MEFIGRKKEVETINYLLTQKGYQGAIIYGRRRLGKLNYLSIAYCIGVFQLFFINAI